jgi:hypothetical protein
MRLGPRPGHDRLDFDPCCGIDPKEESHMHALTIKFVDADTIESVAKPSSMAEARNSPPLSSASSNSFQFVRDRKTSLTR